METQQKEKLLVMVLPRSFFFFLFQLSLLHSITFLLTVLSIHNWKFPLLSPCRSEGQCGIHVLWSMVKRNRALSHVGEASMVWGLI